MFNVGAKKRRERGAERRSNQEKGERKTRKVWSSKSNVQCSMLEPKKEEKGGLRGDQTKKCWSQKNQEEKREGRRKGKHWSQNKKETGCEKSHDDISVPSQRHYKFDHRQ